MKLIAGKTERPMTDNIDSEDRQMRDSSLLIIQTNFQHSMVAMHEIRELIASHRVDALSSTHMIPSWIKTVEFRF